MTDDSVACPFCQKRYRWSADLAGKRVRCLCGAVLRFPRTRGQPFELIEEAPIPAALLPPEPSPEPPPELSPELPSNSPLAPAADNAPKFPPKLTLAPPSKPLSLAPPEPPREKPTPPQAPAKLSSGYELQLEGLSPSPSSASPMRLEDSGESENSAQPPPAKPAGRCPNCGSVVSGSAVLCLNCGFHLEEGRKLQTHVHPSDSPAPPPDPKATANTRDPRAPQGNKILAALNRREDDHPSTAFVDLYLPLILVVGGLVVATVEAGHLGSVQGTAHQAAYAVVGVGIYLAISVPMLLIACLIAAAALDVEFGPLGTALLKLAAISIGPGAIGQALSDAITIHWPGYSGWGMGFLLSSLASMIAYWTLIAVFFTLSTWETMITIMIIMGVRWVSLFFVGFIIYWLITP